MSRGTVTIILAFVTAAGCASATSLYGTYQASATHTCSGVNCSSATDVITGTGSNTLQGASEFTATITETPFFQGDFQPGIIVFTSQSNGGEISGVLNLAWVRSIAPPPFELTGTVEITGGTGPYSGFRANTNVFGKGTFTSLMSATGTVALVPEPGTWSLLLLFGLAAMAYFRPGSMQRK
ncbi:MAG: PEP-CTERM sorting domain-containing protein [Acidobacteriaceae bacterium]|nr:PEP-CTERM sorting domain-containing protein [Acidobacteriaceae bacterium]MBV9501880.1 PEP-CTERM sorting domain-containing protein [Acidobacteriaceae bacterium]